MRIGYMTGLYPRATDTFIQREVMGLREKGIDVQTFSIRRPGDEHIVGPEQLQERDKTYYLIPVNPGKLLLLHLQIFMSFPQRYVAALALALKTSQPGIKGFLYQIFYFLEAGILAHVIAHKKVTHLHNHIANSSCTVAMLAAELGGFSFSFTMHGPHIFFEPMRWRLDEKIKRAKFVACISYFCRSQGMIFTSPKHWQKMLIVRCGIQISLFKPVIHDGVGNNLLYVGRLATEKGLPTLIESLSQLCSELPDLKLTVVGDGPDRDFLEALTKNSNLIDNVSFVGYQSQSAVRQYLRETDIFVLPSFAEGIPVVLMEAMATGVPVVTSNIAGISELVESGKNGYLVPPGEVRALTATLESLIPNADLRNKLGQNGRDKIKKNFCIDESLNLLNAQFQRG